MRARANGVVVLLALLGASACGELGDFQQLNFTTDYDCFGDGCWQQLRGVAVGASQVISISDPTCWSDGDFSVSVTGAFELVDGPSPTSGDGSCRTSVTVRAVSEGRATIYATSPSGASDQFGMFGAVATTMTVPSSELGWAAHAETERVDLNVGDFWWGDVRLTDADRRPLLHGSEPPLVWEPADTRVIAHIGDSDSALEAMAAGETTISTEYLGLSLTLDVIVTE